MPVEQKALFLDRDGVINADLGHVYRVADFHFLPSVLTSCRQFHEAGYKLVVVTNQAGIAKGFYSVDELENLNRWMAARFSEAGAPLAGIFYCPHHPEGSVVGLRRICDCRKPAPGLFLQAQRELKLDMGQSILVGDKESDILAGKAAGVGLCCLVRHEGGTLILSGAEQPVHCIAGLSELVEVLRHPLCGSPARE